MVLSITELKVSFATYILLFKLKTTKHKHALHIVFFLPRIPFIYPKKRHILYEVQNGCHLNDAKPQWPRPQSSSCSLCPLYTPPTALQRCHSRCYCRYLGTCLNPPLSGGPPLGEVLLDSGCSLESSLGTNQTRWISSMWPAHLYFILLSTDGVDLQSGLRSTHLCSIPLYSASAKHKAGARMMLVDWMNYSHSLYVSLCLNI